MSQCLLKLAKEPVYDDPCNPSPCGANAQCNNGQCTCLPEYQGDPYSGCRPECVINNDCSRDKACVRNKCIDPCPGTCGQNAICDVINHIPMCSCPQGMAGNAFVQCSPYQSAYFDLNSCVFLLDPNSLSFVQPQSSLKIHVSPRLAVRTLSAAKSTARQFALAFPDTLDLLQPVVPSV